VETVAAVFGAALCTGLSRFSHLAVCVMFQHSKGGAYLIKTYSTNQRILAPSRGCQNPFLSLITLSDGRRYGYQTVRDIFPKGIFLRVDDPVTHGEITVGAKDMIILRA
jgi:hypothetical protein